MNEFYSQENHGPYSEYDLGDFDTENGDVIKHCKLTYATFGTLNAEKNNVIVLTVMFSGTNKAMEKYVGENLALDPTKYFIVIPNQLGNGLSTSPNNADASQRGANFPALTIGDDVRAQYRLLTEEFGITGIALVVGWSMGAQQTYEWCVRHPELVKRAAPIAGTAIVTPHNALFVDLYSEALRSDPTWDNGNYTDSAQVSQGLKRLGHVFALMGLSTEFYRLKMWEKLGFNSVEELMTGFWEAWFAPMDPNVLLSMAGKWKAGDVTQHTGTSLETTLGNIRAKVFVMPFEEDMMFPVKDCEVEQQLIPNSELRPIPSLLGHFGMLGLLEEDFNFINDTLEDLLRS
jgi:homoserine O-acetyltransferase